MIDPEIAASAAEMGYNAGQYMRKLMLDCGMTVEEVEKTIKEVFDGLVINGVPYRAVPCEHCQGKGWNLPEETK